MRKLRRQPVAKLNHQRVQVRQPMPVNHSHDFDVLRSDSVIDGQKNVVVKNGKHSSDNCNLRDVRFALVENLNVGPLGLVGIILAIILIIGGLGLLKIVDKVDLKLVEKMVFVGLVSSLE